MYAQTLRKNIFHSAVSFSRLSLLRILTRHVIKTCAEMAHMSKKWFQDDVKNNIGKDKSFTKSGKSPSVIFKDVSS